MVADKMVQTKWYTDKMSLDKMVWTKWYTDKMSLDKMVWTKWYGQNGTNKTVPIKSSIKYHFRSHCQYNMTFHQSRFPFDPFTFPLCAYHYLRLMVTK